MSKRYFTAMLLAAGVAAHAAPYSAVPLPPLTPHPALESADCSLRTAIAGAALAASTPSALAISAVLAESKVQSAIHIDRIAPGELQWWLSLHSLPYSEPFGLGAVTNAIHESTHQLGNAATACNGGQISYYFDGQAWKTELRRLDTPPYGIAAAHIPADMRALRQTRVRTYLEQNGKNQGNDFTVLLDEFTAYTGAAELELALAGTRIFDEEAARHEWTDANLGGSADFMLFTVAYLRAARTGDNTAWQRIRNSPLLLAHLQRVWTRAEHVLAERKRRGLAYYHVAPAVLALAYQPDYIGELDRLGIKHLPTSPEVAVPGITPDAPTT